MDSNENFATETTSVSQLPATTGLQSAADFAAFIASTTERLIEARKHRVELLAEKDAAIFGDGDFNEVRRELARFDDEIDALETAIDGAVRRRDKATEAENKAEVEAKGAETVTDVAELSQCWTRAAEMLGELRALFGEIDAIQSKLTRRNGYFDSEHRPDLKANLARIKNEAIGTRPAAPEKLSRSGNELDHQICELVWPRHPGRRPMPGSFRFQTDGRPHFTPAGGPV